ncbi:multisubunit Na+/H+ antiporter, MnhE subunit [Thiohalobacter thiocyanaticus]|uniref:Multisubunit Na+/H+ antiporter, MnhE subunit n=1 Tax=Thiohalobacter thiocyanaticus TaxID=585455 RepID=A0A1Z4VML4_9GAMM|nr:Na+/H+ antiporter subunit E [Thiohalobacter thiocyanaticus]BAZ92859.1 multisubunit Na+/H+ antiporter, MnhE subunit [Thiohalobacter thiocyanaticus]
MHSRNRLIAALPRLLVFALAWWLITEGAAASWSIGVPAVVLATLISARLLPPQRLTPSGLLRFLGFFLHHSLLGAVDVARRAFQPSCPLDPAVIDYPLQLQPGPARVFMLNTVSLLPGTLSADLEADCLRVHVLDADQDNPAQLAQLEARVAALFGLTLP